MRPAAIHSQEANETVEQFVHTEGRGRIAGGRDELGKLKYETPESRIFTDKIAKFEYDIRAVRDKLKEEGKTEGYFETPTGEQFSIKADMRDYQINKMVTSRISDDLGFESAKDSLGFSLRQGQMGREIGEKVGADMAKEQALATRLKYDEILEISEPELMDSYRKIIADSKKDK